MGGPNLEIFKFGLYIMFPISFMYYFGTNLDSRFSVPDFWPKPESTYKIPFEREEIEAELENQRRKRLLRRKERLEREAVEGMLPAAAAESGTRQNTKLPWWVPGDMRRRMEAERKTEDSRKEQR